MRRLTPLLIALSACAPQVASMPDEGDESSTGDLEPGGTADDGPSTPGDPSAGSGTPSTTSSSPGESGEPADTGEPATTGEASTDDGSEGGSSTGEPCDLGTHGCGCFEDECLGELVCVDGQCFEPGECTGLEGTENCACADGECFGDLQCWDGACTAECNESPETNDEHCGGICGNACTVTGEFGGCAAGECTPHLSECYATPGYTQTCPEICADEGKTCSTCPFVYLGFGSQEDCESITDGDPFNNFPAACEAITPFHSTNQTWARCCCV